MNVRADEHKAPVRWLYHGLEAVSVAFLAMCIMLSVSKNTLRTSDSQMVALAQTVTELADRTTPPS